MCLGGRARAKHEGGFERQPQQRVFRPAFDARPRDAASGDLSPSYNHAHSVPSTAYKSTGKREIRAFGCMSVTITRSVP